MLHLLKMQIRMLCQLDLTSQNIFTTCLHVCVSDEALPARLLVQKTRF